MLQRHHEAVMEVRAGNEVAYYVPRHGAGMGDGNACELFVRSFVRPLESWNAGLLKGCRASLATDQGEAPLVGATALAHSPIAETSVDLSMRGRADDVSQTLPRPGGDPFRAARLAQQPGAPLASKLQNQGGFTQSGDKQL